MKRRVWLFALFAWKSAVLCGVQASPLVLHVRRMIETPKGSGHYQTIRDTVTWDGRRTAIIICDMWNQHWCKGATERVGEMAPVIDRVITAARAKGVFIIHSPSDTMAYYKDWPQRRRAIDAPAATPPVPLQASRNLDPGREGPLPIDDSDGGCDDVPQCKQGSPWTHEIDTIHIAPRDAISDRGPEVYNLLQAHRIDHVILMGVHANMCVLGRPFSIRQLVIEGQDVVLMRDLTDTMYNSRRWPYVNHFRGTELVVEHIEKYWCPTITSSDFLGTSPFHFKNDHRPHVVLIIGEDEYHARETLPRFARAILGNACGFRCTILHEKTKHDFPGLKALKDADLVISFIRRRILPARQMALIKDYLKSGRPWVAIRTSCHAFCLKNGVDQPPDDPLKSWSQFGHDVLGCHYIGHRTGTTEVRINRAASESPLLKGIEGPFHCYGTLYEVLPLRPGAHPLLIGHELSGSAHPGPDEPVAWTYSYHGGRIFFTSLGHPDDFQVPQFRRLLLNAVYWALDRPLPVSVVRRMAQWDWHRMRVPGVWEDSGNPKLRYYDGFAWYRRLAWVPKDWKSKTLALQLGWIDDVDETFFNGKQVGGLGHLPPHFRSASEEERDYSIPASLVRPGALNLVAVRVFDEGGAGGFKAGIPVLKGPDRTIKLGGRWWFHRGDDPAWAGWKSVEASGHQNP